MTPKEKELIKIVESNIYQSQEGKLDKETNKFDFKAKWYDLTNANGINEFLKDTTAIVNTIGPTGYIVVGYDEKKKKMINTQFKDSGLNDVSKILGLLSKRVDRAFDIDIHDIVINNTTISVIELPPSIDKPHVIRHYISKKGNENEQMIFVKSAAGTVVANKYHLERMYYDRKNITPDYQMHLILSYYGFQNRIGLDKYLNSSQNIYIENVGFRPLSIKEICFEFYFDNLVQCFNCSGEYANNGMFATMSSQNLIIQPNRIGKFHIELKGEPIPNLIDSEKYNGFIRANEIKAKVTLNNGKVMSIDIDNP